MDIRFCCCTGPILYFHLLVGFLHLAANFYAANGVATDCATVKKKCEAEEECKILLVFLHKSCGTSVTECQMEDETRCLAIIGTLAERENFTDCFCNYGAPNYEECHLIWSQIFRNPCADKSVPTVSWRTSANRRPEVRPVDSRKPPAKAPAARKTVKSDGFDQDHQVFLNCRSAMKDCRNSNDCSEKLVLFKLYCPRQGSQCKAASSKDCQESLKNLTAVFAPCTCPENMRKKRKCQHIYKELFNHSCSYDVESPITNSPVMTSRHKPMKTGSIDSWVMSKIDKKSDQSVNQPSMRTNVAPSECQVLYDEKTSLNFSVGSKIRMPLEEKGCSKVCDCSSGGDLEDCEKLPCYGDLQCVHEWNVYKERGKCLCFDGELICSQPKLNATSQNKIGGVTYLQIGYSVKERKHMQSYVDDKFNVKEKLQRLIGVDSNEESCNLDLLEEEEGNLVLFMKDLKGQMKKKCLAELSSLSLKINEQKAEIRSDVVLSILKVATIHKFSPEKSDTPLTLESTNIPNSATKTYASAKLLLTLLFLKLLY